MEFDDISAREMPHSIEAEQTVLGAVLLDSELLGTVMNYVKPESFYVSKHRELFSIILRQFTLGVNSDIITVLNEAVQEGIFEDSASGKEYLGAITESIPSLANIESYCKIVEEKYYLRSLAEAAKKIISNCTESAEPASVILDSAEQMIYGRVRRSMALQR